MIMILTLQLLVMALHIVLNGCSYFGGAGYSNGVSGIDITSLNNILEYHKSIAENTSTIIELIGKLSGVSAAINSKFNITIFKR